MNEVTKNTQTFLETLQISSSQEVKDWDHEALERAFGWAKYCQEVHRKLWSRPATVTQLNKSLEIIRSLPNAALSQSQFSFDELAQSHRMLLKNPYLSSELYHTVLTAYSRLDSNNVEESKWDTLLKDVTQCAQAKATRSTLVDMLEVLDKSLNQNTTQKDECVNQITMEIDAAVLRDYICHHLSNSPTLDVTKQHLQEKLHGIASHQHQGLAVIGSILALPSSDDETKAQTYKQCDEFVFNWIMTNRDRYKGTTKRLGLLSMGLPEDQVVPNTTSEPMCYDKKDQN